MFETASVMVLLEGERDVRVSKLEMERKANIAICQCFADAYQEMKHQKEYIIFDGKYKIDFGELLYIDKYNLDFRILEAVKEPSKIDSFKPQKNCEEKIKAVFVGEENKGDVRIAFQKFRSEQYISTKGFSLFFDNRTFMHEERFGISILKNVDMIYENERLEFESFHKARQILPLQQYYRMATEEDVNEFTEMENLHFENKTIFVGHADTVVRRRIASIMDSKVLRNYTVPEITYIAEQMNIRIESLNNRLVIPAEKAQMKLLLCFLDEEVYQGVFSKDTFVTNSKRAVRI